MSFIRRGTKPPLPAGGTGTSTRRLGLFESKNGKRKEHINIEEELALPIYDKEYIDQQEKDLDPESICDGESTRLRRRRTQALRVSRLSRARGMADPDANLSDDKRIDLTGIVAFSDIVEIDEMQAYQDHVAEVLAASLIESPAFRTTVLVTILLNTILVGFQTNDTYNKGYMMIMQGHDIIFLTIFTMEILIKWYHGFWNFWKVGWNVFDFLLVFTSIIGDGMEFLRTGRVLRIFRVLRAFRSLRSISVLKGLQVVVQTVVRSLPDMANIVALLMLVNFLFAVVGVDMFGEDVPEHFNDIPTAMFTLFVLMTQDGWYVIYKDMESRALGVSGAVYFMIYVIVGALVFANLIVGVTVTNLMTAYKEMKEGLKVTNREIDAGGGAGGGNATISTQYVEQLEANRRDVPSVKLRDWKKQTPTTVPNFLTFSKRQMENYFLVLIAMEENLNEYRELTGGIRNVLDRMLISKEKREQVSSDEEEDLSVSSGTTTDEDDVSRPPAPTPMVKSFNKHKSEVPPRRPRRYSVAVSMRQSLNAGSALGNGARSRLLPKLPGSKWRPQGPGPRLVGLKPQPPGGLKMRKAGGTLKAFEPGSIDSKAFQPRSRLAGLREVHITNSD